MSDNDMGSAGVNWELLDGRVSMEVIPREEGDLRVRFQADGEGTVWSSIYERGFWESRTKKGEIGNKLADATSYADEKIKDELEKVWTDLTENAESYESSLVSPSVEELIDNTVRVETYGGDEREIHVFVKGQPYGTPANGREADGGAEIRKLVFNNSEWVRSDGDTQTPPVVEKFSNAFFEVLDITWQEWREDIRAVWEDMQEWHGDGQMTTADRIAMSVTRSLKHRLDAHADESKVINDTWNGWYQEDSEHGDVVWVPGDTLDDALDQHDKGIDYRSQLSRALKNQGFTVATRWQTTIDGDRVELYPFIPETVGIEEPSVDVIGYDDDDDDDGEPEQSGGDGGDGGDDGGDTDSDSGQDGTDGADGDDTPADGREEPAAPPEPKPPGEPDGPPDGEPAQAKVEGSGLLEDVISVVQSQDPVGEGVPEANVVAEAATNRDIGPPDDIRDEIERGVLDGVLYRPDDDASQIAVRPGATEASPAGAIDPSEEGVPEP